MTSEHVIISVPHSGTRTLAQHLGDLIDNGKQWHFGNARNMAQLRRGAENRVAHIPIRHPVAVATSWGSRPINGTPDDLVEHYEHMFDYIRHHKTKLYKIEFLNERLGAGEHAPGDHAERVREFVDAVTMHVIEPHKIFFGYYYEDVFRGA